MKFYLLHTLTNVIKLDLVDALCCGLGCMGNIVNDQCLKANIQSSHQHVIVRYVGPSGTYEEWNAPMSIFFTHFQLQDTALFRIFIE